MRHVNPESEPPTRPGSRTPSLTPSQWEDVQHGDPSAINAVCEDWLPTVLQWCRRLCGPRVDADHAAQDVFIVVLRRVHTVDRPEQLASWMFAVTRRVLAQHRRKAWVRRWMPGDVPDVSDPRHSPAALSERRQLAEQVGKVLDQMPDDLRAVLVLCDIEDRTDPEAAEVLGLKVGTAKSRLRRARTRFRELCIRQGIAPTSGGT
jgi:RNA polymerase sigma-70 factor (ECF subfamily)